MTLELPEPIAAYVAAENHGDAQAVARCFAREGLVRDEGETHRGAAEIAHWAAETRRKYAHTIEPLGISRDGSETIVACRLAGSFPGSPITLAFAFHLAAGKVSALEIRP